MVLGFSRPFPWRVQRFALAVQPRSSVSRPDSLAVLVFRALVSSWRCRRCPARCRSPPCPASYVSLPASHTFGWPEAGDVRVRVVVQVVVVDRDRLRRCRGGPWSTDGPLAGAEDGKPSLFGPSGASTTRRARQRADADALGQQAHQVAESQRQVVAVGLLGCQAREQRVAEPSVSRELFRPTATIGSSANDSQRLQRGREAAVFSAVAARMSTCAHREGVPDAVPRCAAPSRSDAAGA